MGWAKLWQKKSSQFRPKPRVRQKLHQNLLFGPDLAGFSNRSNFGLFFQIYVVCDSICPKIGSGRKIIPKICPFFSRIQSFILLPMSQFSCYICFITIYDRGVRGLGWCGLGCNPIQTANTRFDIFANQTTPQFFPNRTAQYSLVQFGLQFNYFFLRDINFVI